MNKKITVHFKNGKIIAKGNADDYHIGLASQKLRNREIEPTFTYKVGRFFKRLLKTCIATIEEALTVGNPNEVEITYIDILPFLEEKSR